LSCLYWQFDKPVTNQLFAYGAYLTGGTDIEGRSIGISAFDTLGMGFCGMRM